MSYHFLFHLSFYLSYDFVILISVCGRYFVLGLPTGSTPLGMYRKLVEYYKNGKVTFKYVKTFNMDEYASKRLCSKGKHMFSSNFNCQLLKKIIYTHITRFTARPSGELPLFYVE